MSDQGLASWGLVDLVPGAAPGDPVKTTLLKTLEALLRQNLPELATVRRDWPFPFDLTAADDQGQPLTPLPALFFYQKKDNPGQLGTHVAKNTLPLELVVFAAFAAPVYTLNDPAWQSFTEWADALAGKIHALWWNRGVRLTLKNAGLIGLQELENSKAPASETYGELVLPIRLIYGHALGDAFTMQLS